MIRSLDIENFRCFKSLKLSDIRRFNIITGASGSGKTALLEALFIAGGNSAEIYLRTSAFRGKEEIRVPQNEGLSAAFEDYFHQFNIDHGLHISFIDSNNDKRQARIVAEGSETVSLPFEKSTSDAVISRNLRFFWDTPEGTHESTVEITSDGLRVSRMPSAYFMVLLNTQLIISGKDNAARFSDLAEKNKENEILLAMQKIFPEVKGLSVLTPKGGAPGIWCSYLGIERKIPVTLVSQGITKFLAIILAIAAAPGGAVLIDEIENGMYYKTYSEMWHAIVQMARENKTQLFVTTHSKEFLDLISPIVEQDNKDYSLIRMARLGAVTEAVCSPGKEFSSAIESGFDVR